MSKLIASGTNEQFVIDSREVAEMVDKRHSDLLSIIGNYEETLTDGNFRSLDFYIPNAYVDAKGETRRSYLITKKGCDMIANKMTGSKGVLFTARYVTKFEEMEKAIKQNQIDTSALPKELQMFSHLFNQLAESHLEAKRLNQEVEGVKKTVDDVKTILIERNDDWRKWVKDTINKAVSASGEVSSLQHSLFRNNTYEMLEARAHCKLGIKLKNLIERLEKAGATKTKIANANNLDVIESDTRLKEIYTSIIKELAIKWVN